MAHAHCCMTIRQQVFLGTCVPCAQYWEGPGQTVGLPRRVLPCANAAGCSATKNGVMGQK